MTPSNTLSSANSNQNTPATAAPSSTSTPTSAPSSSTSRPLYPRTTAIHPVKSSLPNPSWHELPRLQLAPPEHQKQPHAQVKQLLQQQQQNISAPNIAPTVSPQSLSSSRSVSPNLEDPNKAGDKRKSVLENPTSKKRRTEQPSQRQIQNRSDYPLGTHYHPYYPSTASVSTSPSNQQSPIVTTGQPSAQTSTRQTPPAVANSYSTFSEFQWRLLHLCSEFYEAATELLRSTPQSILSQAFQLFNNGAVTDPISVLNDARRTCDILLASSQGLAPPPPLSTPIPAPNITSLLQMNARSSSGQHPMPTYSSALSSMVTPAYPSASVSTPTSTTVRTLADIGSQEEGSKSRASSTNFANIPQNSQVQGAWKEQEIAKLKELAGKYCIRKKDDTTPAGVSEEVDEEEGTEEAEEPEDEEKSLTGQTEGAITATAENAPGDVDANNAAVSALKKSAKDFDEIDWDRVVTEFGDERSRHQILIKATFLGLKPSSSLPGVKKKKKKRKPASKPAIKSASQPISQLLTNVALPSPAVLHASTQASSQILTLTPASVMASASETSGSASYDPNSRIRPGAVTSPAVEAAVPRTEHAPTASQVSGGGDSSLKSTARSFNVERSDKTASVILPSTSAATKPKGQSTTTATSTAAPAATSSNSTATTSMGVSSTTVGGGIPNVSAYGTVPSWGYAPAPVGQLGAGQGTNAYYPYAGMYYPQYPIQGYSISSAPAIPGVAPGAPATSTPMFVQTHFSSHASPHAHPHGPVGQTFFTYVPRTEDNPGPKKTRKTAATTTTTTTLRAAGPPSSTFIVPTTSNNASRVSTDSRRPASTPTAATPKPTAAEPQAPI